MKQYFDAFFPEFTPQDSSNFKFFLIAISGNELSTIADLSETNVKSFELSGSMEKEIKRYFAKLGSSSIQLPTPAIGHEYLFNATYYFNSKVHAAIASIYSKYGIDLQQDLNGFGKAGLIAELHLYETHQSAIPKTILQYRNVNLKETSGITFDYSSNIPMEITNMFVSDQLLHITNDESVALNPSKFTRAGIDNTPKAITSDANNRFQVGADASDLKLDVRPDASFGDLNKSVSFDSAQSVVTDVMGDLTSDFDAKFAAATTKIDEPAASKEISSSVAVDSIPVAKGTKRGFLQPEIREALKITKGVLDAAGVPLTITSGSDTSFARKSASLHYTGNAVDIRTGTLKNADGSNYTNSQKKALAASIKDALGSAYFVQYEAPKHPGASGEHIHIEYETGTKAITIKEARKLGDKRFDIGSNHHHEHDGHNHR